MANNLTILDTGLAGNVPCKELVIRLLYSEKNFLISAKFELAHLGSLRRTFYPHTHKVNIKLIK